MVTAEKAAAQRMRREILGCTRCGDKLPDGFFWRYDRAVAAQDRNPNHWLICDPCFEGTK